MTPGTPVTLMPVGMDYIDEQIQQYREQDQLTRAFGMALKTALDAWVSMKCCGTDRQLEWLEQQRAAMLSAAVMYPPAVGGLRNSHEEFMIRLIEERDALIAEIEQAQRGLAQIPVEGMGDVFEASIIAPMRRNLQYKEQEISALQERIEAQRNTQGAATPGPRETENPS